MMILLNQLFDEGQRLKTQVQRAASVHRASPCWLKNANQSVNWGGVGCYCR